MTLDILLLHNTAKYGILSRLDMSHLSAIMHLSEIKYADAYVDCIHISGGSPRQGCSSCASDGERRAIAQHLRLQRLSILGGQFQHVAQLQQLCVVGRHGGAAHVHLVQLTKLRGARAVPQHMQQVAGQVLRMCSYSALRKCDCGASAPRAGKLVLMVLLLS